MSNNKTYFNKDTQSLAAGATQIDLTESGLAVSISTTMNICIHALLGIQIKKKLSKVWFVDKGVGRNCPSHVYVAQTLTEPKTLMRVNYAQNVPPTARLNSFHCNVAMRHIIETEK